MTRPSSKIIVTYLLIGITWILVSDRSFSYFGYPENSIFYQTLKGIGFIVISGIIFWLMLRKYEQQNQKALSKLKKTADELIHSNQRYSVVTNATNNIIWDWDFRQQKVLWGKSLTRIFGYKQLIRGDHWWTDKIHPHDQERVREKFEAFIDSASLEKWADEYRIIHSDGSIRHIHDRGYLLFDKKGNPIRMIGSLEDITERKQHEQQLSQLNSELNNRASALADSNAELEQFAYIASHDLQEPLRMVTGFLTQLEKKYDAQLDEKGKQYIHFAVDGAVRMRKIILDLLEYSKTGKTAFRPERIDTGQLIDDILDLNKRLIEEEKVTVKKGKLPVIRGGKTLIQQVFQNLIVNAIKYKKAAIDPVITISGEDDGDYWKFSVSDNGIGIHPDFFEKIFILFQRLHSRQEYSGTGIGLAVCKKIIENHGGKIGVESEEGKGSVFYFTIKK